LETKLTKTFIQWYTLGDVVTRLLISVVVVCSFDV